MLGAAICWCPLGRRLLGFPAKGARRLQRPVTPVRAIITTENMESRARVGLLSPVSIVLATRASSIVITAAVSTSVP